MSCAYLLLNVELHITVGNCSLMISLFRTTFRGANGALLSIYINDINIVTQNRRSKALLLKMKCFRRNVAVTLDVSPIVLQVPYIWDVWISENWPNISGIYVDFIRTLFVRNNAIHFSAFWARNSSIIP